MSDVIKKEEMDMDLELELDKLEEVSGGSLESVMNRVKRSGHASELRNLLKTQGKPAAAERCCKYFSDQCGLCGAIVTML